MKLRATINGGKLHFKNDMLFREIMQDMDGKLVEVSIDPWYKDRTNNQKSYYWGVVIKYLCDHTGYDKDEMHNALKDRIASVVDEDTGLRRIESTASMSTERFTEYVDDVARWAASFLGVNIPPPGGDCGY